MANEIIQVTVTDPTVDQVLVTTTAPSVQITDVGAIETDMTPTPWTAVTLQNSWVNAGTYGAVMIRKVGDMVQVRGRMSGGVNNSIAFTFPTGFRPSNRYIVPVIQGSYNAAGLDISPDGTARVYGASPIDLMFEFSITP